MLPKEAPPHLKHPIFRQLNIEDKVYRVPKDSIFRSEAAVDAVMESSSRAHRGTRKFGTPIEGSDADPKMEEILKSNQVFYDESASCFVHEMIVPRVLCNRSGLQNGRIKKELERSFELAEIKISSESDGFATAGYLYGIEPLEDDEVIISVFANDWERVIEAQSSIRDLIGDTRKKIAFTHFFCIPLLDPSFASRVEQFKKLVLSRERASIENKKMEQASEEDGPPEEDSLNSSWFSPPNALHFTLVLLRLVSKRELKKCIYSVIPAASRKIYDHVGTHTLLVRLRGVYVFTDDPRQASVLFTVPAAEKSGSSNDSLKTKKGGSYAGNSKPQHIKDCADKLSRSPSERALSSGQQECPSQDNSGGKTQILYTIISCLIECLKTADLITDEELHSQRLLDSSGMKVESKIHATIIHAKYAQPNNEVDITTGKKPAGVKQFDATKILELFRNFDFGEIKMEEIHLSERQGLGETVRMALRYECDESQPFKYKCLKKINLP